MMLSESDRERRRLFLTATDIPAILGVSPYRNAADVYIEKTTPLRPWAGNSATEAGSLLEPAIVEWARTKLGPINPGDWRVHENGVNACTLDGILPDGDVVECKTHGIVGPTDWRAWGSEGTDEIPDVYNLQVQAQMFVTGAKRGWVPALLGGRGFQLFCVPRHEGLQQLIEIASNQFWERVQARQPPEDVSPHIETLKCLERVAGKAVELPDEVAEQYLIADQAARDAAKARDRAYEAVVAALQDAEIGRWQGGEFTYRQQTRKAYTVEAGTYRVLRAKQKAEVAS